MMKTVEQGQTRDWKVLRRESEACGQSSTASRAWCEQSRVRVDADTWTNPTGRVVTTGSEETFGSKLEV